MAEKNNATCSICGKPYHMCLSCNDIMKSSPWKMHTDTPEHYKVFQIIRGYNTNVYTKDEAKKKLENVDLSDLNTFRENIKKTIKNIMDDENKSFVSTSNANAMSADSKVTSAPRYRKKKIFETAETE